MVFRIRGSLWLPRRLRARSRGRGLALVSFLRPRFLEPDGAVFIEGKHVASEERTEHGGDFFDDAQAQATLL